MSKYKLKCHRDSELGWVLVEFRHAAERVITMLGHREKREPGRYTTNIQALANAIRECRLAEAIFVTNQDDRRTAVDVIAAELRAVAEWWYEEAVAWAKNAREIAQDHGEVATVADIDGALVEMASEFLASAPSAKARSA